MPDKDITIPQTGTGLDNTNFDPNQGLQKEAENWLSTDSKPLDLNIQPATLKGEKDSKKPNLLTDIKGFADQINSTSGKTDTEDKQFVSKKDLPDNYNRYNKFYVGADNEDIAGNKQSTLEKALYTVPRVLGTFGKTVLQGITAPIAGLGYLATGGNFVDNEYNKWLESWEKTEDNAFPLYQTNEEKNTSFIGQLAHVNAYAHLAEFIGMSAGMYVTGNLTAGLGEAVGGEAIGNRITTGYMNAINKLSEVSPILAELDNGGEVGQQIIGEINNIQASTISDADKLDKITKSISDISKKYTNQISAYTKAKQAIYGSASMLGINAGMGSQAGRDFKDQLTQRFIQKNGYAPTEEDLAKIDEMSKKVGQWTFGLGTLMSTISFHGILKSAISKDGESLFNKEINPLFEKVNEETSLGTEYTAEKPLEGKSSMLTKAYNWSKPIRRVAGKVFDPWAGVGLAEFSTISPSVESYYNKKYDTGDADVINDALGPNAKSLFTKEGLSTFFEGMIGSGPFEVGRKIKEEKQKSLNTSDAISTFNNNYLGTFLKGNLNSIKRGKSLRVEYLDAIKSNDIESQKTLETEQLENYIYPRIKYGMKSLVDKDLDNYRKLASTEEGIRQLQNRGELPEGDDINKIRDNFTKHLDSIQEYSNKAQDYYKSLTLRYGNATDKDGNKIYSDEHIEKLMFLSGMVDDQNRRIKLMSDEFLKDKDITDKSINTTHSRYNAGDEEDIKESSITANFNRLLSGLSKTSDTKLNRELYNQLEKDINSLQTTDDKKANLVSKVADIIKLSINKRDSLKDYHKIVTDPNKYKDSIKEQFLSNYTENKPESNQLVETISLKTSKGDKDIKLGNEYYSGSPITLRTTEGPETTFTDFKLIKELPEENKYLIKANDHLIPVDKDFLKDHDISETNGSEDNLKARFYRDNQNNEFTLNKGKDNETEGYLNYSPTDDKLYFNSRDPQSIQDKQIKPEDFKDGTIKKVEDLSDRDKDFINNYYDKLEKDRIAKLFQTNEAKNEFKALQTSFNNQFSSEDYGTNDPLEDFYKIQNAWESKKIDISNGLATSSVPTWSDAKAEPLDNYWAVRDQEFLNGLNTIKENTGQGIVNPNTVKVIPIHFNNASIHGFEGLIPSTYKGFDNKTIDNSKDTERASIHLIYAHQDEGGKYWTLDKNGKKISEIKGDNKQDLNNIVYTRLSIADFYRKGNVGLNEERYTNKFGYDKEQLEEILAKAKLAREELLNATGINSYEFSTSRGIPNEKKDPRTKQTIVMNSPVVLSGLVKQEQIGQGLVFIPTRKTNGLTNLDEASNTGYITINEQNIKMPLGRPLLKNGSDLVFLNNKKFTEKEAKNLYKVIKAMTTKMLSSYEKTGNFKLDSVFTEYLSGVLHFNNRVTEKEPKRNQIFFEDQNELVLGKDKIAINPDSIEQNEITITNFLENAFHNVNNYKLSKVGKEPFNEIIDIDKEGNPIVISHQSYEHYLLSDKYELDKDRTEESLYNRYNSKDRTNNGKDVLPLTTNIVQTVEKDGKPILDENGNQEPSLIQKYITLKDYTDFTPTVKEKPEEEPKEEEENKEISPTEVNKEDEIPELEIVYDGKTPNILSIGIRDITFTVNDSGNVDIQKVLNTQSNKEVVTDTKYKTKNPSGVNVIKDLVEKELSTYPREEKIPSGEKEVKNTIEEKTDNTKKDIVEARKEEESELDKNKRIAAEKFKNAPKSNKLFDERRIIPGEEAIKKEDIEEIKQYLKTNLPNIGFESLPHAIKTGDNTYAWGVYKDHYIQIYNEAPYGTGYHEAFHAVWNSFLSDREQQSLYDEFRKRPRQFTDRLTGNKVNFIDGTNKQVREAIAEEFRDFKINEEFRSIEPKKEGFFKRLVNFIKHFVFGKPETIQGVFNKIDSAYYKNQEVMTRNNIDPEYSAMKGISESMKRDIIHGLGQTVIRSLRLQDGELIRLGEGKLKMPDLVNPLLKSLKDYYENPELEGGIYYQNVVGEINDTQLKGAIDSWDYIKTHKEDVIKDLRSFFRKHKIVFTKPEKLDQDITQQEDEVENTNEDNDLKVDYIDEKDQREYDRDPLKLDAKKNAPIAVKIAFDFITKATWDGINETLVSPPEDLSTIRLPQLEDNDNKYFNMVMNELSGVTGINNMSKKLKELAKKQPALVRFYKSFFEKPFLKGQPNENQVKFLLQFEKTFSKQKPDYLAHIFDEEGGSYSIDSNLSKDTDLVIDDWENNIRSMSDDKSGLVSTNSDGYYTINTGKVKNAPTDKNSSIKFLNEVGLNVPKDIFEKLNSLDREELVKRAGALYSQIQNKELGIKNKLASKKSLGVETHLRKIAELLTKANGGSGSSQHLNIDRESVQNYVLPNYISNTLNRINQTQTVDEFLSKVQGGKDIWRRSSQLLKKGGVLYDAEGKPKYNLVPVVVEGLINQGDRTSNAKMNRLVRYMQMFNMNLGSNGSGVFYNLIPADSKTEYGVRVGHYITTGDFKSNNFKTLTENIFKGYLKDEIDLIRQAVNGERKISKQVKENGNYKKLRFFKDILSADLVKKITDFANDTINDTTVDDFVAQNKEQFSKDFWDYTDSITNKEKEFLTSNRILQIATTQSKLIDTDKNGKKLPMESWTFEEEPTGYNFFGLNSDFTREMGYTENDGSGRKLFNDKNIDSILKFRLLNLMIHNTELHKVFFGDPAEYKDSSKRIKLFTSPTEFTHIDDNDPNGLNPHLNNLYNKVGDVNLKMGDLGYHTFSDFFKALTFNHGDSAETTVISPEYEEIKAAIGEKLAEIYSKINEMDAQGIMLDTYWREYQIKSGGAWEADHELQHQYDMALARHDADENGKNKYSNKELKEEDEKIIEKGNPEIVGMATPLKPKGAGLMENDNQMIPFSIKDSVFRLSYSLAKGRGLEDLYWFMHSNNIGLVGPESHQKFGRLDTPKLYNNEGKIALGELTKEQLEDSVFSIPYEHFAKIVETSASHDSQTIGTQLRSLSNLDSFNNGVPIDYFNPLDEKQKSISNFETASESWNKLSEEEKRTISSRYRLYNDSNKALGALSKKGYDTTLNKLGVTEGDGKYKFSDPSRVANFLLQEVTRRELPDNIADAIDSWNRIKDENDVPYPLEALPNYNQLKQIIWSTVDKNIIRYKVNGSPKILVASTGFEKEARKFDKKTGKIFSSPELKFYTRKGENGKTTVMEVYLPNIFRDALKKAGSTRTDAEILEYLNSSEEGKRLLKGIGFRIPTQGLNSMDTFIVKDFLPQEMGDSIVVPSEMTAKVGSDFDIDKLNTYLKNFYIGTNGYPKEKVFYEDTNSIGNLKDIYDQLYKGKKENQEERLIADIFGSSIKPDKIPSLEEFIKENKGKDPFEVNSKEAIENKYFDTLEETLTLPENYARLVTPNSSEEFVNIEKDLAKILRPEEEGRNKKDINYANLLNPLWLNNERQTFLDAKALVGIAASNNTSHAINQSNSIYIKKDPTLSINDRKYIKSTDIWLEHPKIMINGESRTSISGLTDSMGTYISDKISQYINGSVDAANDPWLVRLLTNKDVMSTTLFLDRIGVSARDTFFFINQPSIQDYIKKLDIQKAVAGINPEVEWQFTDDLLSDVKENYPSSAYKPLDRDIKHIELSDMLSKYAQGKELNESERIFQKQILDEFMKYKIMGDHLFQIQTGTSWSNMNKPDDVTITLKDLAFDYAKKENVIDSPEKVISGTVNDTIRDLVIKAKEGVSTIFKTKLPNVQIQLKKVLDTFGNYDLKMKMDDRKAIIEKANLSMIDYAIQNFVNINGNELNKYIYPLLIQTGTHLGKELRSLQNTSTGDLANNLALEGLKAMYKLKENDLKNIQLQNRPTDAYSSNNLTESLRELRDNPKTENFYKNLIMLGLLQNGIRDSRISFNKYIPYEDHEKYVKPAIEALENTDLNGFGKSNVFFRNNWQDDRIVPKIKKVNIWIPGYGRIKDFPYYNNIGLKNISKSENNFIYLHELSTNFKYPVVKLSEIGVNTETQEKYTRSEIAKMKANGDNSYYSTKVFQRVEETTGRYDKDGNEILEPIVIKVDKYGNNYYLYKQINAWGDGSNFQEYYSDNRPSVLDRNLKINELTDNEIANELHGTTPDKQEKELPFEEDKTTIDNKQLKDDKDFPKNPGGPC